MGDQVISLTSSDEEGAEPPLKKRKKITPNLPECTVTLVSGKPTKSASELIQTVSLDSDDEISVSDPKNNCVEKTTNVGSVEISGENIKPTNNVDLISLTDDEEDTLHTKGVKVNGVNNSIISTSIKENSSQICQETVSVDDSDNEVETSKKIGSSNDKEDTVIKKREKEQGKNNHSIIIDDSDDETEKENHCENGPIETFSVHIEKTSATEVASASTPKFGKKHLDEHNTDVSDSQKEVSRIVGKEHICNQDELEESKILFNKFIKMIEEKIVDSTFEEILPKKAPIIKKHFNRSGRYVNNTAFKTLLIDSIERIRKSSTASGANSAVLAFHKVFEHLKSHVTQTTIIVDEDNLSKIKKLEYTLKLLRKRIHQLEVAEVDFADDEDSTYIMLDRYENRFNKVYAKYCQLINRNPHNGRATYDRITFVNSSYNEINQALTRKYKNSLMFPSYYELENYIRKISKKEKLNLSDAEIKLEGKKCFRALGNILQKKRKQELYDSHLDFIETSEDPATKDISLENALKKNYVEGKDKIDKIFQKYVNKQERGEDHVSSDEEQSSEECEDGNKKKKDKIQNNVKKSSKTEKKSKKKSYIQHKQNNNQDECTEETESKDCLSLTDNGKEEKCENKGKNLNEEKPKNEEDKEIQESKGIPEEQPEDSDKNL